MTAIDLSFHILGSELPVDHAYPLYGAISRLLPEMHDHNGIGIHPIAGMQAGGRSLRLNEKSRLTIRIDSDRISTVLALAGKELVVSGNKLRVGVPQVYVLTPAPVLRSRLVTIKLKEKLTEEAFLQSLRRKLAGFGISDQVQVSLPSRYPPDRGPCRRTLRIKQKEVVGYEVLLEHLSPEESLNLQENRTTDPAHHGFSRRHMGCGIFVPVAPREEKQ